MGDAHGVLDRGIVLLDLSWDTRSFALDFLFPRQPIWPSVRVSDGPSGRVRFTAVEECVLLIWPRAIIESIRGSAEWIELQNQLIDSANLRSGQRLVSLLTKSAVERYRDMHAEFPKGWQRLPQHLIASYLGVTPQYLCQLKRVADRQKSSEA